MLSATFTSADTAAGTIPNADTGQVFGQAAGTGTAGWRVLSNAATDTGSSSESFLSADSGQVDATTSLRIVTLPSGGDGGLVVRLASPSAISDCLLLNIEATEYVLYRRAGGGYTSLGTIAVTPAVGDVLTIVTAGSSVIASAGSGSLSVTESSGVGNTYVGVRSSGATKTLAVDDLTSIGNSLGAVALTVTSTMDAFAFAGPVDLGAVHIYAYAGISEMGFAGPQDLGAIALDATPGLPVWIEGHWEMVWVPSHYESGGGGTWVEEHWEPGAWIPQHWDYSNVRATLHVPIDLGAIPLYATTPVGIGFSQPGTLANPYAASDSDSRYVDFNSAAFVPSEPTPLTGEVDSPSVWFQFTETQLATWLASTSGFAHGASIELFTGPEGIGATADDVTFLATDGSRELVLGAVAIDVLPGVIGEPLISLGPVDLGAVTLTAGALMAGALT